MAITILVFINNFLSFFLYLIKVYKEIIINKYKEEEIKLHLLNQAPFFLYTQY